MEHCLRHVLQDGTPLPPWKNQVPFPHGKYVFKQQQYFAGERRHVERHSVHRHRSKLAKTRSVATSDETEYFREAKQAPFS